VTQQVLHEQIDLLYSVTPELTTVLLLLFEPTKIKKKLTGLVFGSGSGGSMNPCYCPLYVPWLGNNNLSWKCQVVLLKQKFALCYARFFAKEEGSSAGD